MATTVKKLSVSIDSEDLAWAQQKAKSEGRALSTIISEALHRERKLDGLGKLVTYLGGDDLPDELMEQVRREIHGPRPPLPPPPASLATKGPRLRTRKPAPAKAPTAKGPRLRVKRAAAR